MRGLSGTGLICDLLPAFGLAERYHRRAVELAERLQHPQALGQARMLLAYHHDHQAQWAEALEQYRLAAGIVLQYRGQPALGALRHAHRLADRRAGRRGGRASG